MIIFDVAISTMFACCSPSQLFDHIASCIANFMHEHDLIGQKLPLGFTFSFPCKQEGLAVGRLITWTKGFTCEGVQGEDVVKLLHEAIDRRDVSDRRSGDTCIEAGEYYVEA